MSERISDERLAELITDAEKWIARGYMDEQHLCALRELAELREQTRWIPIETAPRDGRPLLVRRKHSSFPLLAKYRQMYGWFEGLESGVHLYGLTHWMPLPEIGPLPTAVERDFKEGA